MFVCPECGLTQPGPGPCPTDRTPLAPIGEDVLLGTTIGAYRVARLLGIGGMGRVYKGAHPTIGSRVAIKVLSRECSDRRDLVERFFSEARAVNVIRHESIVNVLDLSRLPDGRPYIIMEYLDGAPLAAILDEAIRTRTPLPLGGLARLAVEVLDALGAAHGKGVVHRDLKPDNIFVAPSGRPKVLDFGIAKLSDANLLGSATRTGSLLGTPHYMSAEQAAGRPVDHRADLYAIGVILFECATGRKPFQAEALFDLLRMHVEVPPPSPRALRPDMPPELEHVILTALAKAPDHRFPSAMAMSMALQHATAQLPPDQWRPLTPPAARPPGSSSWAPTPPSSWPGPGSRPPTPQPPTPMPPMPPPAPQPPSFGNASTLSAGQVTRGGRPASRRGLWIALAAVAMTGGGITAGALLASSRNGGSTDPNAAHAGSTDPATTATSGTPQNDPWAAAAPPAQKTPAAASDDSKADSKDDDDEDDAPSGTPPGGDPTDAAIAEALKQIDATIKSLPPGQRKQLAAYRKQLAAYKGLSKLPLAERAKRLRQLQEAMARGMTEAQGMAAVEAPDPAAIARAAGATTDDDAPAAPSAPVKWVTNHSIDPPAGYDPEHLDVTAFVPWAIAQARKAIPDAQLIRIDADGVTPDGRANLKLPTLASGHGSIDVRFISPSRGKRDPRQPLGVGRRDFKCEFRVMATPDGVELMPIDFFDCNKEHVVPVPRCSLAAVWKKAIARKAPSYNAVGNVGYRSSGSRPVWYFGIGFGADRAFSEMFGDDC
ncbi:MAG TPA: serine/threonine-protein kinase [Vicinamibacterales bacterium]|nr:serine/threonine-protein kinase [Vicinamibacterales bacterium]